MTPLSEKELEAIYALSEDEARRLAAYLQGLVVAERYMGLEGFFTRGSHRDRGNA